MSPHPRGANFSHLSNDNNFGAMGMTPKQANIVESARSKMHNLAIAPQSGMKISSK